MADIVTFDLSVEFSSATPPAGSGPWLSATFTDDPSNSNNVLLDLSATNLTGVEFVSKWLFNLDPALDAAGLVFSDEADKTPGLIELGDDAFKADGDGWFDIKMSWDGLNGANPFGAGANYSATIALSDGAGGFLDLDAQDFSFLSTGEGNSRDGLFTAAHVQGIGTSGEESGWVTVPAPGASLLGMLGLSLVGGVKRRLS